MKNYSDREITMKLLWIFLSLPLVHSEYGINKKCITPHGDLGICKEVTACHLLRTYRPFLTNVSVKKYFQQSYCGKRYGMPLICCGPEGRNVFEECGEMEKSGPKIFGGNVSDMHFPWMAAIQYRNGNEEPVFKCQGFLINPHFVLTAAHCLRFQKVHAVVLGVTNLTDYEEQEYYKKARVINVTYHEDYIKDIDDIGLIRIKPIKYTDRIRWICLPTKNTPLPEEYTIRGWGKNDKMVTAFSAPLESRIRSASYSNCRLVNSRNISWNRVLCAGGERNKDSCDGDSGGALMNKTEFGWTAFGIVSFGSRDCSRGDPGVYTRIQYYLDWLDRKMLEMLTNKN